MPLDTNKVILSVLSRLSVLDSERAERKEPPEFVDQKDAMLYLNTAWQSMTKTTRERQKLENSLDAALWLAAVAVKYVTDLGQPLPSDVKRLKGG